MKEFFNNFKLPIILGGCALVAVIATLIVVTGGFSSGYGLYITTASGSVSVTSSDVSINASNGDSLKKGDIVTIGDNSSCVIAYQGKNNSEDNYLVLGANTQIVISDAFKGKGDSEIYLRNGTIIGNFAAEDNASVIIRTTDSTITLREAVSKISYRTNEFTSYTELYTFMGYNKIQLYDEMGDPMNEPEYQAEKLWGRIISESGMFSDTTDSESDKLDSPRFDLLNNSFDLNELTAFDLKQLLTIAALVGDGFPYDASDIKAVYDAKGGDTENTGPENEIPEETSVTTEDNSDSIQTAEPIETTAPPTETTLPGQTTLHVITQATTAATTTPPPEVTTQASSQTSAHNGTVHMVTIIIDGEETIQEVAHGEDAVKPADPVIDGMTFIGWDGSFENITEDKVITAMFSDNLGGDITAVTHTVTVVIGTQTTTLTVEDGGSANLPENVNVEGYVFKGWDKDYREITSDITITAILEPVSGENHTVTFIVNGQSYYATVADGGTVVPPVTPTADSGFIGWDKPLENITADTTITAIFAAKATYTVTFAIDGQYYYVTVTEGGKAEPPFIPEMDSFGNVFVGWDRSLDNIMGDTLITAVYSGR